MDTRRPSFPAADVARLVARLGKILDVLQADTRRVAVKYLPAIIEGAAAALREAGRPVTPAEVAKALCLGEGADGWSAWASLAVLEATGDPDMTPEEIRALARREGREAALGYPRLGLKEASDGEG